MEVGQDGRVGGRGAHFLPTNTSEIHLHVEQLSQKTHWKLADLLRNQSCKEDPHVTGWLTVCQPQEPCFTPQVGQTWRQASDCVLLSIFCFGTKLKGHTSWSMFFSWWYRRVRGLVRPGKHAWNLHTIGSANLPLLRESHMTKTSVSGAGQFTLPLPGHCQGMRQRERVKNWEQQSKSATHIYNHMMRCFPLKKKTLYCG